MNGKELMSIVTNSDKAMCNAIKSIFLKACHWLCAWHLERNATANVGNTEFIKAFKDCMFVHITIDVFEHKWKAMVERLYLQDNAWV